MNTKRLLDIINAFSANLDGEIEHREKRHLGGQHVPHFGEFVSAPQSMLIRLQWWRREMVDAATQPTTRLLVCGGRDYRNSPHVFLKLDELHARLADTAPIELVIHGGATGVDTIAQAWAWHNLIPVLAFPVSTEEWGYLGRAAGPLRNKHMLAKGKPNLVVAFPGGPGTTNMIKQAENAGVKVEKIC